MANGSAHQHPGANGNTATMNGHGPGVPTNGKALKAQASGLKGQASMGVQPGTPGSAKTPRKGVQPGSFVDLLVRSCSSRACLHQGSRVDTCS